MSKIRVKNDPFSWTFCPKGGGPGPPGPPLSYGPGERRKDFLALVGPNVSGGVFFSVAILLAFYKILYPIKISQVLGLTSCFWGELVSESRTILNTIIKLNNGKKEKIRKI